VADLVPDDGPVTQAEGFQFPIVGQDKNLAGIVPALAAGADESITSAYLIEFGQISFTGNDDRPGNR
jgi:hypothetical protein